MIIEENSKNYLVELHSENKSVLRLLYYPRTEEAEAKKSDKQEKDEVQIRCKPHSDYGSITLLLTDGVPGLQALVDVNGQETWIDVPHVPGALVVNIGSLLSDWTKQTLKATLHRVVSTKETACTPRTSLAFFADPNPNVSALLMQDKGNSVESTSGEPQSVAEYIAWRSGGTGKHRSGVAFDQTEQERAKRAKIDNSN